MSAANFPEVSAELLQQLPPILKAVVKALGFARARDWLQSYGGLLVTVPAYKETALDLDAAELDRLRQTIAPHLDATRRLALPKADKLLSLVRNESISRERYTQTCAQQAKMYNLTVRQITNIRRDTADQDVKDSQGSLF